MTGYDPVSPAEAGDRTARVLAVPCPKCDSPPGRVCVSPAGHRQAVQHAARWDAWYAAHPEASTP